MAAAVKVRYACAEDVAVLVDFNYQMALETENRELSKDTLTKGIQRLFDNPEKGQYYVAVDESDSPIACLMTTYEWSDWRNTDMVWIQSVYVKQEFRRQGVFRLLYQFVEQACLERGNAGLRLYVEHDNEVAQKTYQAMGMEQSHYLMFEREFKRN